MEPPETKKAPGLTTRGCCEEKQSRALRGNPLAQLRAKKSITAVEPVRHPAGLVTQLAPPGKPCLRDHRRTSRDRITGRRPRGHVLNLDSSVSARPVPARPVPARCATRGTARPVTHRGDGARTGRSAHRPAARRPRRSLRGMDASRPAMRFSRVTDARASGPRAGAREPGPARRTPPHRSGAAPRARAQRPAAAAPRAAPHTAPSNPAR